MKFQILILTFFLINVGRSYCFIWNISVSKNNDLQLTTTELADSKPFYFRLNEGSKCDFILAENEDIDLENCNLSRYSLQQINTSYLVSFNVTLKYAHSYNLLFYWNGTVYETQNFTSNAGKISGTVAITYTMSQYPHLPLNIEWSPPSITNGDILQYLIVVKKLDNSCNNAWLVKCVTCDNDDNNKIGKGLSGINITERCTHTIPIGTFNKSNSTLSITRNDANIEPYTNYTIWIQPSNGWGQGDAVNTTIVTGQYISGPISNLTTSSKFPESKLKLDWQSPGTPNGTILQYVIVLRSSSNCVYSWTMKCNGCENDTIGNGGSAINITEGCTNTTYIDTFNKLDSNLSITRNDDTIAAYKNYTVLIQPVNGWGWGIITNVSLTTGQYKPGLIVNLTCKGMYNDLKPMIMCNWSRPIKMNGILTKYTVEIATKINLTLSTKETNINITNDNLSASVNYTISVMAHTIEGNGNAITVSIRIAASQFVQIIDKVSVIESIMKLYDGDGTVDSTSQIGITIPFDSIGIQNGVPTDYSLLVSTPDANISPTNGTDVQIKGNSFEDCKDKPSCKYQIQIYLPSSNTNTNALYRVKRVSASKPNSVGPNTPFIVGDTKDNPCAAHQCNGYLKSNIKYTISLRVYTSAGYSTVAVIQATTSPNIIIPIVVSVCVIVIISVIVLILLVHYRQRICAQSSQPYETGSDSDGDTVLDITINPYIAPTQNDPLVHEFSLYLAEYEKDSCLIGHKKYEDVKNNERRKIESNLLKKVMSHPSKDRYQNIKAYEHNIVKLSNDAYINASQVCPTHLSFEESTNGKCQPSITCHSMFIATQGPLDADRYVAPANSNNGNNANMDKDSTTEDFWQMVVDYNVGLIVMVTKCEEKFQKKCAEYWPIYPSQPRLFNIKYIDGHKQVIEVELMTETNQSVYKERKFNVRLQGGDVNMVVYHIQYLCWPDFGTPIINDFFLFYQRYVALRRETLLVHKPIIVHCSAGVGRTGTLMLIDTILSTIHSSHDKVTIAQTFQRLRDSRCLLVQTEDQYHFVHRFIAYYLEKKQYFAYFPSMVTRETQSSSSALPITKPLVSSTKPLIDISNHMSDNNNSSALPMPQQTYVNPVYSPGYGDDDDDAQEDECYGQEV